MNFIHHIKRAAARSCLIILMLSGFAACSKEAPTQSTPAEAVASTKPVAQQNATSAPVTPVESPTEIFWQSLSRLCDQRYPGQLTIGTEESDREIGYAMLYMNVERCKKGEIDIAFIVDNDNSRTWQLRYEEGQLALYHRHINDQGKPDETSGYGGLARATGNAKRQEFPADENTANMIPAAATNVWAIEIVPDKMFAYELQRIEEQRMFRVVFDLTSPVSDAT